MVISAMKVLIADDHFVYREALQIMLKPYGSCVAVGDGEQAVEKFSEALQQNNPFNLVLLDIQMPYMDGITALKKIRLIEKKLYGVSLDSSRYSCIIMQTNMDDIVTFKKAFKEGRCNGFIKKPVTLQDLLEKLRKHNLIL